MAIDGTLHGVLPSGADIPDLVGDMLALGDWLAVEKWGGDDPRVRSSHGMH